MGEPTFLYRFYFISKLTLSVSDKTFIILLRLTPDDITRQRKKSRRKRVKQD